MFSFIFIRLCVLWFKMRGWRIPKTIPPTLKQYVIVVAPHTSNVDFPVGIATRFLLKINVRFVAKKELFKFPVKGTLLKLGGYPVDRSKKSSFVDKVSDLFREIDDFALCITPEGTRGYVDTWRTGFYHIATKANVPFVLVGFDYHLRVVVVSDPMMPTGDMEADFRRMDQFFGRIVPRVPENSKYHSTKKD